MCVMAAVGTLLRRVRKERAGQDHIVSTLAPCSSTVTLRAGTRNLRGSRGDPAGRRAVWLAARDGERSSKDCAGASGPKETACPQILVPVPYHCLRDKRLSVVPISIPTPMLTSRLPPSHMYPLQSLCGHPASSRLSSPRPYPKLLQLTDPTSLLPLPTPHSHSPTPRFSFLYNLTISAMRTLSLFVSPARAPLSCLSLLVSFAHTLSPAPHPTHDQVQSTGQVLSIAFSPAPDSSRCLGCPLSHIYNKNRSP